MKNILKNVVFFSPAETSLTKSRLKYFCLDKFPFYIVYSFHIEIVFQIQSNFLSYPNISKPNRLLRWNCIVLKN